jgi:SulP family sulfate permease
MKQQFTFKEKLKHDVPASVMVFLVALPLCLGIALASGAPAFSGVLAGIIGGIVVGRISGSQLSVSGPAAGLTVIVVDSIHQLGSYEAFLLAVCIAGVFQIILGFLNAGVLANFFPSKPLLSILILQKPWEFIVYRHIAEGG